MYHTKLTAALRRATMISMESKDTDTVHSLMAWRSMMMRTEEDTVEAMATQVFKVQTIFRDFIVILLRDLQLSLQDLKEAFRLSEELAPDSSDLDTITY